MNEIESYIASQLEERRQVLEPVHTAISRALPEYTPAMSYGMPTYKSGKNVIHFAAQKKHLGIYPGAETIEHFAQELALYKTSKGAVQIPVDQPIPLDLIAAMAVWSYRRVRGLPEE